MLYQRVAIESLGYTLPREVVTTAEIEERLSPLYDRLRLPQGRLELMTGIRERRFFAPGTRPSQMSLLSARRALVASGIDPAHVGCMVHGSVCRDFLEPATACGVHHELGLPETCSVYDISNACLGLLTGATQIANMIELGQIRAGIVVGTECGRNLVEGTIAKLNTTTTLSRDDVKFAIASLTIGSASVAIVLCDSELSRTGNRLLGGAVHGRTQHHRLCQSDGLAELMQTDSETLMHEGIATGVTTFDLLKRQLGLETRDIDRTFCHQVGVAHRKMLFERLGLDLAKDYATLERLGNTGSAALPVTMAMGLESAPPPPGSRIAMLGIGSGINCVMLAAEWQQTRVAGATEPPIGA
jgi:acyl-CoA:acyl-CoA alkyltransferase